MDVSPRKSLTDPGRVLVPGTCCIYAAPGGAYSLLGFAHVEGYLHVDFHLDASVVEIVARIDYTDFDLVEAAANTILLVRGCDPSCRYDRGTTLGLFLKQHYSDSSSFVPSTNDSHTTSAGGTWSPSSASDAIVLSSSWPSLEPPVVPLPTPSLVRLVPVASSPHASSSHYGSGLLSWMLHVLSPGEQQMYGPAFQLDTTSDLTYHPSDMLSPIPIMVPHPAPSGFRYSGFATPSALLSQELPHMIEAPGPVSHAHVRIVSTIVAHPSIPSLAMSLSSIAGPSPPLLVPCSTETIDVSMSFESGQNTNATGLGDCQHAIPESSLSLSFT
ncbi:hypothetical protein B9Z19DRAFT_1066800 [Tuber borchii]|uniref:Uncharacterized protein n=1 Tax=Tuber borchii TaxID=42251 RepID=A0A2T6ZLB4_TUBBO|nr:hypothetical protein B9Z19DRAFT_1066800 [Tuber borchii]